jgi:hypothetical protein
VSAFLLLASHKGGDETKPGGVYMSHLKISTVSSDPAVSAQNNLQRQFFGDYNVLVSSNDRA